MRGTRQRGCLRDLAITAAFLCRVPSWHSVNPLPSARHTALDKKAFAMKGYADSSLLSAALGKGFTECKASKHASPVVRVAFQRISQSIHSALLLFRVVLFRIQTRYAVSATSSLHKHNPPGSIFLPFLIQPLKSDPCCTALNR